MTPTEKRTRIKFVLGNLTDANRNVFVRMYSPADLQKDINAVVDSMPVKKLEWALQQVENTYYSIFRTLKV